MNFLIFIFLFSNTTPDSSSVIHYSGDKIVFNVHTSLVQIYGNAGAKYGQLKISADTILYDLQKKLMTATGDVLFNEGNNDIKARKMTYDVNREFGDAFDAKTKAENGWFLGKRIRYFKGNILRIRNGFYTTCENDPPHFWFYSPKMRIDIGQSLVAEPVFLLIQDIPVFFVPFYMQSLKKERSSGILRPEFGTSSRLGNYIKSVGWYQTLGDHADIAAYLNYYAKTSIRFNIDQMRWNLMPYSMGNITGNYIKEKADSAGNIAERWELMIDTKSKLPGKINLNVDTRIRSDDNYLIDYEPGEVFDGMEREINYNINWNGKILGARTDIIMDHRENLTTDYLYERWPSLNMSFPHLAIGGFSIRSYYKFIRDEDRDWASAFSGNSNLNFNFLVFNIGLALDGKSNYYKNEDVLINHWGTRTTIKTNLYGFSFFGIAPITKFRHVITPSVSFSYAPDPGPYNIASISGSGFSVPHGGRSLNVSLDNLFQCKIGENRYDFASLRFSSYYLYNEYKFSPVSITGEFWVGDILEQRYSTYYDFDSHEFGEKRVETDLRYRTEFGDNPFNILLSHKISFTETDRIQNANLILQINPTPKWKLNLNTHYDFQSGKVTSNSLNLVRDLHCWELTLSVNSWQNTWDYSIRIGLRDIPELKIERGTLGGFIP